MYISNHNFINIMKINKRIIKHLFEYNLILI